MTTFRHDFRASAQRMINGAGQPFTYQKTIASAYDPATGIAVQTYAPTLSFNAYVGALSYTESRAPSIVGIKAVEVWVAYADLPTAPVIGSLLVSQGSTYEIVSLASHSYSAGVACWVFICKQG